MKLLVTAAFWSAVAFAAPAWAAPVAVPSELQGLTLACDGSASWTQKVTDDNGTIGKFSDDTETSHARSAAGRVHVRFGPDDAAFRLPPTFPNARSGAWWPLVSVDVQGDRILGAVRGILGPSRAVKINRQSGEIELTFSGTTFSGTCEKVVEQPGVRKF